MITGTLTFREASGGRGSDRSIRSATRLALPALSAAFDWVHMITGHAGGHIDTRIDCELSVNRKQNLVLGH